MTEKYKSMMERLVRDYIKREVEAKNLTWGFSDEHESWFHLTTKRGWNFVNSEISLNPNITPLGLVQVDMGEAKVLTMSGSSGEPEESVIKRHYEKFRDFMVEQGYIQKYDIYAIGDEQEQGSSYGMWAGPNPSLEEMLKTPGRSNKSVIWGFVMGVTEEPLFRWSEENDGWEEWKKDE